MIRIAEIKCPQILYPLNEDSVFIELSPYVKLIMAVSESFVNE